MAKAKKQKQIKITLVRGLAGTLPKQRRTVKALGLGRISSSVVHDANPVILGMVNVVSHLVKVEEM
ncbi:MAG: 50S ribosomal protein L30 [Spirochaetes bacterium ADurb.Bin315]|jgi:large subunit ribosomal protein L30|nr:50S ribosomal protein L30 [Spirochaetota bacterium]NLK14606.1 50S ribosomal protein L30 [Spirochaetales bacterium]OQA41326.1 MAG: 50S ribosomal protein L30 [Spirochaetes bacterium ADurb.Bin315]TAH58508.1 MAG: 50S ribosomal protein L30 [Sphaerochaeta sp.]HNZ94537.1 50S ribosomal protein L30 [Sphaerochaeta sp.]